MARAGRKDRGLLSKLDSAGKPKWYARLYHEGKEKRFGPFKDKTEARNFYNKAKLDQLQGRFFPERYQAGGKELASKVIDTYLATLTISGKKPRTVAAEKYYGAWWKARLNGKALHAITPQTLEDAMADLSAKSCTPQTIVHYLKFLRHVIRWAIARNL